MIQEIYETEFIDKIFEDFSSTITRENFVRAVDPKIGIFEGLHVNLNPFGGEEIKI